MAARARLPANAVALMHMGRPRRGLPTGADPAAHHDTPVARAAFHNASTCQQAKAGTGSRRTALDTTKGRRSRRPFPLHDPSVHVVSVSLAVGAAAIMRGEEPSAVAR